MGQPSEVTLHHPDDLLWFINFDETQHRLDTSGPKGGSQTQRYHNPSFSRGGDRVIKNDRHITGVYATNPLEVLPPLYIFDTKAKSESNYNIDPEWCRDLPTVVGKFGTGKNMLYPSFVAMQPKGSMDKTLYPIFINDVILKCYPNVQKETVRDEDGRKVKGPIILKTDTGPGRLCKDITHVTAREELYDKGVHNLLGLPNGTKNTQEMDQGFTEFKPATDKSTVRVAARKMAKRVEARKLMKKKEQQKEVASVALANTNYDNNSSSNNISSSGVREDRTHVDDLEEYLEEEGDADWDNDDDDEENFTFEVKGSVCNVKINNCDLSSIVNGFPGDPISLRPFDKIFTRQNIWLWWCKVGFIPMNRNTLNDDKVRQQLGGEKASVGDQGQRLQLLVDDYEKAAAEVNELGFRGEVLDLELEVAVPRALIEDESERIKKIVEEKAANKTGGLFKLGCQVANERVVMESCKQIIAEEMRVKAERLKAKLKKEDETKSHAIEAYQKFVGGGKLNSALSAKDFKMILKFLLPKLAPNEKMAEHNTGAKALECLQKFATDSNNDSTAWHFEMSKYVELADNPSPPTA